MAGVYEVVPCGDTSMPSVVLSRFHTDIDSVGPMETTGRICSSDLQELTLPAKETPSSRSGTYSAPPCSLPLSLPAVPPMRGVPVDDATATHLFSHYQVSGRDLK